MTPLEIVKREYQAILPNLDVTNLKHVYTSGSVARNEFNANWSDVDINVVADAPLSFASLSALNELCRKLEAILHCKVGLDFIPYKNVLLCAVEPVDPQQIADCLGFIKNNHESNSEWLKTGTLFQSPDTVIASIPKDNFQALPIEEYMKDLQVQVYETLMRRKTSDGISLHEMRILTKACLYLLQTYILTIDGTLYTDYYQLPDSARAYMQTDTSLLKEIYTKVKSGDSASLHTSYEDTLQALLELFNALIAEIQ